jgi:copper resistance protein C
MDKYSCMALAVMLLSGLIARARMARQHRAKNKFMSLLASCMLAAIVTATVFVPSSLWLAGGVAYAHAHLQRSEPRDGTSVIPAPSQVALWFTERLEPAFSGVEVRDSQGNRVDLGEPEIGGASMRIGLKALSPGTYKVNWHALSVDTHKSQGTFSFQVGQ